MVIPRLWRVGGKIGLNGFELETRMENGKGWICGYDLPGEITENYYFLSVLFVPSYSAS